MDLSILTELVREHRAIEGRLDRLAIEVDAVRELEQALSRHYATEDRFLDALAVRDAKLAAKLRGQHDEALELAERLLESLATDDAAYLARRLVAIVQHNIIEEERDVFPLVRRDPGRF